MGYELGGARAEGRRPETARVVVLGGGTAGLTAALHLTRMPKRTDDVVVVTPNSNWNWNWIPSNIWVGVGRMRTDQATSALAPVYRRTGTGSHQALATAVLPEGDGSRTRLVVDIAHTDPARPGPVRAG